MTTHKLFIHCPELDQHPYPEDSPFNTSRAGKARQTLMSMGFLSGRDRDELVPAPASREELLRFHEPEYLDILQEAAHRYIGLPALERGFGTPECPIFAGMYEYAALAAGATLAAATEILEGRAAVAFNPSGGYHHAHPGHASGFCYINDIVLACQRFAEAGKRVLFLDIDAHHCDGVQDAFYDRDDVLVMSMHQSGKSLFPGTGFEDEIGTGRGKGFTVNIPLPQQTYDDAFREAFYNTAVPIMEAYRPDVIVLELGADGLIGDPLAQLSLTNNVFADVIQQLLLYGRPICATGGGGYHVENAARAWAFAWTVLCGDDDPHDDLAAGIGGVFLSSTDWQGGLRDPANPPDADQRKNVDDELGPTLAKLRELVFPIHGLKATTAPVANAAQDGYSQSVALGEPS